MKILVAIAMASILLCCSEMKLESDSARNVEVADATTAMSPAPNSPDPGSKLIKTADYHFRVADVRKSSDAIERITSKFPAHVSSSNLTMEGHEIEMNMTIRVRSEFFSEVLKEIDREAIHTHYRNIRTEDVTKQFIDLEARLKTKQEVQERLKQILRTRAGKIEELLSAEQQIGDLQEEIEATVGKINYLKGQVSFSTINLRFYQRINADDLATTEDPGPHWSERYADAFLSGGAGLVDVSIALVRLWPLLLAGSLAWFFVRRRRRAQAI